MKIQESQSDDIVGTPAMDQLAVVTLNSYPQMQPYELRTEIYRNEDGNLEARPPTKLGPFGGAQLVDMKNVEGIAHTHPYFTRRQGVRGGFDARARNRDNREKGPGDHLPVVNNGVPNYIRTPKGDAVIVVERIDGRIQTRTVWER